MHPLDALLMPYEPSPVSDGGSVRTVESEATVTCERGGGPPQWIEVGSSDLRVFTTLADDSVGDVVVSLFGVDGRTAAIRRDKKRNVVHVPFSFREAYESFILERWAPETWPGLSSGQLAAFYRVKHVIPRRAQLSARRMLIRVQRRPQFPRWPFDASVAALLRLYVQCLLLARGRDHLRFRWFWPEGARVCFVLTHDVESAAGLRGALTVADAEEVRGYRSSFNVVGDWYPIDRGIIDELRGRGFEIGVHGLHHDRSLFSSRDEFERQLPALADTATSFGGAVGFRSPATHRVLDWIAELPFEYDCTVPMTDPYEPQPGGCCSPWPYFVGPLVELPWTLPQDHLLLTLLGERTPGLWIDQFNRLERESGLVQCLTHPDPGYLGDGRKLHIYTDFLDEISEREHVWHALPRDVSRWWHERADVAVSARTSAGIARLRDEGVTFDPEA